jgi:hypothetical protein
MDTTLTMTDVQRPASGEGLLQRCAQCQLERQAAEFSVSQRRKGAAGRCAACLVGGNGNGGAKAWASAGGRAPPTDLLRRVERSGDGRTLGLKKARLTDAGAAAVGEFLCAATVAGTDPPADRPFIDTVRPG